MVLLQALLRWCPVRREDEEAPLITHADAGREAAANRTRMHWILREGFMIGDLSAMARLYLPRKVHEENMNGSRPPPCTSRRPLQPPLSFFQAVFFRLTLIKGSLYTRGRGRSILKQSHLYTVLLVRERRSRRRIVVEKGGREF